MAPVRSGGRTQDAPAPQSPFERRPSREAEGGTHVGSRKSLLPALPSAPSLIGTAALALAAAGAVVSQQTGALADDDFQKFAAQASVLNAASSFGSTDVVSSRERAVSRDAERQALQRADDAELAAEAEALAAKRAMVLKAGTQSAREYAARIARNAWAFPLTPGTYHVSYNYGQCSYLWSACHTGEDFSAPSGTPIVNIAKGVVTSVGYDGAYGNKTVVTLTDGTEIWYCHQSSTAAAVGEQVDPGDLIGYVGTTGNTTGSHLHLEVRPGGGDPVSPLAALDAHHVTY